MTITARWADLEPGTTTTRENREMVLTTSRDVCTLIDQLGKVHTSEAHLAHANRPKRFNEWLGTDELDHQVVIDIWRDFGYMEFIDSDHNVQLIGDPTSPERHTSSSGYFYPGSGVGRDLMATVVSEFLSTGQLPNSVAWRENDEWAAHEQPKIRATG